MKDSTHPAVYVQSNETDENRVVAFSRGADGALSELGSYATGGGWRRRPAPDLSGLADTDERSGRHLLVANAGSGHVSLFALSSHQPSLRPDGRESGPAPKSIAEHEGLVYVLNTDGPTIVGFRLVSDRLRGTIPRRALARRRLRPRPDRLHA